MLFLTPQTLVNDMANDVCPAHEIVCVVIDEAHKATGSHAYAQVVSMRLGAAGSHLALSATPGQNIDKIQEVVSKLRIHRMEARRRPTKRRHGLHQRASAADAQTCARRGCASAQPTPPSQGFDRWRCFIDGLAPSMAVSSTPLLRFS